MRREIHATHENEMIICKAFGIEPERLEYLKSIARFIGRDWGMKVELGEPGKGSCFNPEENRIQFDPLHLSDPLRVDTAEFVSAHEGGHRAVTRTGESLGLTKERVKELYSQLGFGFGFNAVEDPAENNWWSRQYEGCAPWMRRVYDGQFEKDAAVLGTPEINRLIQELGSTPRFAHFGSELIRLWHTGGFSEGIPDDVRLALERSRGFAEEFFNDIPTNEHPAEADVLERARSRFTTFQDRIWPEMEQLVKEDLRDERLRKMVEEKKEDGLSKSAQEEIEQAMKEAAERAAGAAEQAGEIEAKQKEKDAKALRDAAKKMEGEGDAEGAENMRKRADELEKEVESDRDRAAKRAKQLRSGGIPRPVPLGELSLKTRQELEKAFGKLSKEERARLEQEARQALEELEDALNDALKAKLSNDEPESHKERKDREEMEKGEKKEQGKHKRRLQEEHREITQAMEGTRTEYDRAYADVAPLINEMADELDRLFLPNRHPRWVGGFPTGGRLNLQKAMQIEARPDLHQQLWDRKTIPHKHDFRFTLLIDLSGSMRGEKIKETFCAAVLTVEALTRAGLQTEVLGFQDDLIEYKSYQETLSDTVRSRMSGMPAEVMDANPGGHNQSDWNDDGYCVDKAATRLAEQPSKDRFLIVLSDGVPIPSSVHAGAEWDLGEIINAIQKKKNVRLIGLGLGPGTEHIKTYYPNSAVIPHVRDLPRALKDLFTDIIQNPETY